MEVQQLGTESIPPLGTLATNNYAQYILESCLTFRIWIPTKLLKVINAIMCLCWLCNYGIIRCIVLRGQLRLQEEGVR